MADAVGVQVADGLEDRLRAVVLAGVDGLAQERLVGHLVGGAVVLRRVALLLAREVDAHHQQALVALSRAAARATSRLAAAYTSAGGASGMASKKRR